MSECAGKTNIRLEVKWSDCAPGEIPELPANARLKINAGRWASQRGTERTFGCPPPPPFFQDDVNKERKAVTNAAGATTRLPIHLSVVFRFKSDQSSQRGGGGVAGTEASVIAI